MFPLLKPLAADQAELDGFLGAAAAGPLDARDAPGNFLRHLVGRVPLVTVPISGRFDIGNLASYVACDEHFARNGL